ncbi:MAG: hypothetical protein K1000chlam2_01453 [Chlamydiae bacterium]|nr:hypothetical protein [Chlamydiota bacterium]
MMKKSLLTLLIFAILYVFVQLFLRPYLHGNIVLNQSISILYLWIPGIVALAFVRAEGTKLAIFARPNKAFYFAPILSFAICALAFVLSIPFGGASTPNPAFIGQTTGGVIGYALLFFVTSYLLMAVLFAFIFLGGELYWRGYLWDKLKKHPLKAIWITALFWSLWQLPITAFSYSPGASNQLLNVLWTFGLNFTLSPILTYFRVKGHSILTAAIFYSSLMSAFVYFTVLFPMYQTRSIAIYGGLTIALLILFSFGMKLYSSFNWKKIT